MPDKDHLEEECRHLQQVFLKTGYTLKEIKWTCEWYDLKRTRVRADEKEEPIRGVAVVPFCHTITNRLARLLSCRNIRTTLYPLAKLRQRLRLVKDRLSLKDPGVCRIPCECGVSYIGQTGRLVSVRITERKCHTRLGQTEKSEIAQHCWVHGH